MTASKSAERPYLLQCPFCGAEPNFQQRRTRYIVACVSGACFVQPSTVGDAPMTAASHWNYRGNRSTQYTNSAASVSRAVDMRRTRSHRAKSE